MDEGSFQSRGFVAKELASHIEDLYQGMLMRAMCIGQIDEEESVGDIDLFSVTGDGTLMAVNPKWLQHLQERRLSDEGQPRKVKEGEDPHK